jgi:hypothetical protein
MSFSRDDGPAWVGGLSGLRAEVARLTAENERLQAKLEMPCGSCHPCTEWANQTWINAGLPLPHVIDWQELKDERNALKRRNKRLRAERDALQAQLDAVRESLTNDRVILVERRNGYTVENYANPLVPVKAIEAALEVKGEEACDHRFTNQPLLTRDFCVRCGARKPVEVKGEEA